MVVLKLLAIHGRAKMILAGAAWLIGYDGHFDFDNIGDAYIENNVPYIGIRAFPSVMGALVPVVVYAIMRESGYPAVVGLFSTVLVLLGESAMYSDQFNLT